MFLSIWPNVKMIQKCILYSIYHDKFNLIVSRRKIIVTRLFIIGNGFDVSHGLKTTYEDFHNYLKKEYPDAKGDEPKLPESTEMPDGSEEYDENEIAGFLMYLISKTELGGDKWSDLENSLGLLDFDEFFDYLPDIFDRDGDHDYWHEMYNNQDQALNLVIPTEKITEFFSDWINTIKINKNTPINHNFVRLMNDKSDMFLTFNYTKTLEILYHAKKACHIHGVQGEQLLFGHGDDTDKTDYYQGKYTGSEDSLQKIQSDLRKDTASALNEHSDFFDMLSSSVDRIYSYGFSFSDVDKIYIQEICHRISTDNVVWYLNDFDCSTQRKRYKKVIMDCGFKGKFDIFHT